MKLIAIILLALSLANANSTEDKFIKAFKTGHQQGVSQIEREFDMQGWEEEEIFPKEYLVYLDIKNIAQSKILLYKNFAFFEGLMPLTVETPTKNIIVFNSFARMIDAKTLAKDLNEKIPLENDVSITVDKREKGKYVKKPFMYKHLFDKMLAKIESKVKGKVFVVKDKTPEKKPTPQEVVKDSFKVEEVAEEKIEVKEPKQVAVKTVTKQVKKPKTHSYQVSVYKPKYPKLKAYRYGGEWLKYNSKDWVDEYFLEDVEKPFYLKKEKIKSANIITTKKGIKYLKIMNQNLFVELDYVKQIM